MILDLERIKTQYAISRRAPEEYLTPQEELRLFNTIPSLVAEIEELRRVVEIAKEWKQARIIAMQTHNGTWKPEYRKAELDFWVSLAELEGKK
jgi:hypothetical protein